MGDYEIAERGFDIEGDMSLEEVGDSVVMTLAKLAEQKAVRLGLKAEVGLNSESTVSDLNPEVRQGVEELRLMIFACMARMRDLVESIYSTRLRAELLEKGALNFKGQDEEDGGGEKGGFKIPSFPMAAYVLRDFLVGKGWAEFEDWELAKALADKTAPLQLAAMGGMLPFMRFFSGLFRDFVEINDDVREKITALAVELNTSSDELSAEEVFSDLVESGGISDRYESLGDTTEKAFAKQIEALRNWEMPKQETPMTRLALYKADLTGRLKEFIARCSRVGEDSPEVFQKVVNRMCAEIMVANALANDRGDSEEEGAVNSEDEAKLVQLFGPGGGDEKDPK